MPLLDVPTIKLPTRKFTIPESSRQLETDPHSFTIQMFTVGQELDANRAAASGGRFEYELLERCVIELDGKTRDQGVEFINKCSPPVRVHFTDALDKISMPPAGNRKAFLDSEEIVV